MDNTPTNPADEVLKFLNQIAPDTFNEGEFGNWTFTSLARKGDEWRIGFRNRAAADGDVLTFELAGEAFDPAGNLRQEWLDALNNAIFGWEGDMVGED